MADLLHDDFRLAAIDTLYRCHDHLLAHREALFTHLKERWIGLFGASYDILLYDLTSTYFEVDANGPVTEASKLKAFGYSRDKRPDCVQIVIALIITPEGLPIGYEVMRGNTSDKTTLGDMLKKSPTSTAKSGALGSWIDSRRLTALTPSGHVASLLSISFHSIVASPPKKHSIKCAMPSPP